MTPEDWAFRAVEKLCTPLPISGLVAQQSLPGSWLLNEDRREANGGLIQLSQRFALPDGYDLKVVRIQPGGQLRRFTVELYETFGETTLPRLQAMADGGCRIHSARRIVRQPHGPRTILEQLDSDLATVKWIETLEAPWPEGRDPGGPRVALVDSGLAYDLPIYRDRLARDSNGIPLGYDFWDSDPRPYDGDVSRSPFLPIRHGSAVASVLVREAPMASLIPYRYPRPDMSRMGALVEMAAESGVRIIVMPLGSPNKNDWLDFEAAMRQQPDMLAIVSAGNDGRNIDGKALWPAALKLDNLIVVTSADGFGKLAPGSNWGPVSVDIMLPAENIAVIDFRGAKGTASGSSYAVPRLAALAARLLDATPDLTAKALKERIFERATPSPYEDKVVAVGWIPDPLRDR
ncbi:MAG: S8 family serine peptidase [Hyphomicrobiales bacterium]|nr:S8 family serine peptidase [Hyphomicrobiales bacterium]